VNNLIERISKLEELADKSEESSVVFLLLVIFVRDLLLFKKNIKASIPTIIRKK
jgi:hypothetical protein